jgi:hypothetical protein
MTGEISPAIPTRTLAENETIIARGIGAFIETGLALADVRDRELYREAGYENFSAYLVGRWPALSRAQAYRAIDTAHVAGVLSPIGDTPANEAQARALAPLREDADAMREVWQQARAEHGDALTAADVRAAVEERLHSARGDETATGEGLAGDRAATPPDGGAPRLGWGLLECLGGVADTAAHPRPGRGRARRDRRGPRQRQPRAAARAGRPALHRRG